MAGNTRIVNDRHITPGALYRMVLLAFGLVVAGLLIAQLISLVLAMLIVVIIALPLSSFATLLQRFKIPRGLGTVIALLIMLGAIVALVALTIPVFNEQVKQFAKSLPTITDELRHRLGSITGTSPTKIGTQIQNFINGYTRSPSKLLGPLESIGTTVAGAVAAIIVILLTSLYTAIHPEPLRNGLVRMVPPGRRFEADRILDRLRTAYLGWLRGLALGMLVLGGVTYIGLRFVANLQFAEFFAVFTAIAMIIPYYGALISMIPPVLYALTLSPGKAIVVVIIYLVSHQLEGNVIEPLVVARTVQLHPALVAVGVVAVEQLFGFVGLIVSVPIIATVKILIEEIWVNPLERREAARLLDQEPAAQSRRDRRGPRVAPPPPAGRITRGSGRGRRRRAKPTFTGSTCRRSSSCVPSSWPGRSISSCGRSWAASESSSAWARDSSALRSTASRSRSRFSSLSLLPAIMPPVVLLSSARVRSRASIRSGAASVSGAASGALTVSPLRFRSTTASSRLR